MIRQMRAAAAHPVEGNNDDSYWWRAEEAGVLPHRSGACTPSARKENEVRKFMQTSGRDDIRQVRRDGPARTFAELLYRYRLAAGLSRLELAGRVLCSENYIYRLESRDQRHRRVPTPWIVRALAEALELNTELADALLRARDRLDRDLGRPSDTASRAVGQPAAGI